MKERRLRIKYLLSDLFCSMIAWSLFFLFRKIFIENQGPVSLDLLLADTNFLAGILAIPLFWIIINFIYGYYRDTLRKSRLRDLGDTFMITLVGTIILFFVIILDDRVIKYTNYYISFIVLFGLQFFLIYIPRFVLTTNSVRHIQKRSIGFKTIIIGGNGRATDIFMKISNQRLSTGNIFVGFINVSENSNPGLEKYIPRVGSLEDLDSVISENDIREVILAIEPSETDTLNKILNLLLQYDITVKSIPGMYDILLGRVKMSSIFGTPLILLNDLPMPAWQQNIKQLIDVTGSVLALFITLPLSIVLAVAIRIESRGPVIFSQERIGKRGKPFRIFKFRSMQADAEGDRPLLSFDNDPRITGVGRFMRKHRLDEIPNFLNVIKGDMSIVGPRPERQYFIDTLLDKAPQYRHLFRIKPGITSWGQVKYGYASDIDQMIDRLEYDLLYLENMSLIVDLKIIIYTVLTIVRGRGI